MFQKKLDMCLISNNYFDRDTLEASIINIVNCLLQK